MDDADMFLVNTREAMYFFHSWRETRILRAIRKIGLYKFLPKNNLPFCSVRPSSPFSR